MALARWIQSDDLLQMSSSRLDRFDRVKQHIVDTVGAMIAGSRLAAGAATSRLAGTIGDRVGSRIVSGCAYARSTEIDDIHLASCTTPGAVIVPTILALASSAKASAGRRVRLRTVGEFCAATLAGYETLIRFGVALDGPVALHRGVWPTHAAAAFGSAAAASRACKLSTEETVGALVTALAFGSGRPVPGAASSSSRWATLGIAAANGELATRAAGKGLRAVEPRDAVWRRLARGLPRQCLFDDIGMKPYATARQGLAAIEAARDIVERHSLDASDIDRISVALPDMLRRVVDRSDRPATRFESIVSVQYQIALAIAAPDRLLDVDRTPVFSSPALRRLQSKIRVRRSRELDRYYPDAWPARVTITVGRRRFIEVMLRPHGDAADPLGWDDIAVKFQRLTAPAIGVEAARRTVRVMQGAKPNAVMPRLWELAS
jgi:2-methylcitrate dehydratase PrpD